MDKIKFEEYLNYQPKKYENALYYTMNLFYISSCIILMILSWKYFPVVQNIIFNKENDIVFSLYSVGIFSIALFFLAIVVNYFIFYKIFSLIKDFKRTVIYYDILGSKTRDYNIYLKKDKASIIFIIVLIVLSLFFILTSMFVHLRMNDTGIYYNKMFNFKEQYYSWSELKSVSIYPKISRGKNKNLSPEFILEFAEKKIDIWDGAGLGSPDADILIKTIKMINKNTSLKINKTSEFNDEVLDLLYNSSTKTKRNNIIKVFDYLNKM
ncbi:MAG: hypothetical protein FWB86_03820 [Treponema sp.]|nr:hypothetical protein [Treponema sp.]MCL2251142.1 hypothetical protein [Treponema sp.]